MTLSDGLEETGEEAFRNCYSLTQIVIPNAVKRIHGTAFNDCSSIESGKLCDEIEDIVNSVAMCGWWNQGVYEQSLISSMQHYRPSSSTKLAGQYLRNAEPHTYNLY